MIFECNFVFNYRYIIKLKIKSFIYKKRVEVKSEQFSYCHYLKKDDYWQPKECITLKMAPLSFKYTANSGNTSAVWWCRCESETLICYHSNVCVCVNKTLSDKGVSGFCSRLELFILTCAQFK